MPEPITVLLTGAGGSAAANVLDALCRAERPYRIVGVDASATKLHLSRAELRFTVPRASDAGFAEAMRHLCVANGVAVVHAQPDPDVIAVGAARDQFGAATFLPPQHVLELAADKERCAARLTGAGVAVPESRPIASLDDAGDTVADLLSRCGRVWIRARTGAGARASLPVRQADQAVAWIRWWVDERGMRADEFMAAEMLPGHEFAYQSLWQDGDLVAGQARERVEYLYGHLTPSGQTSTPSVARTVQRADVDAVAQRAVRALDPVPQGIFCVDIKEDVAGRACVTEVNAGRFFTTSNFFAHAGLNMPDMAVRCALGERPARLRSSPLPPDLYWIRMVDMGYVLVPGDELDRWARAGH